VAVTSRWKTVDWDADGRPLRQVATIDFARSEWKQRGLAVRVLAVRTRDRLSGKQIYLWDELDYTVQVFLTNDFVTAPEEERSPHHVRERGRGHGQVHRADQAEAAPAGAA